MALKAVVKVSSVTNLSDARYCAGMGVDMLGFDINPSAQEYVNPLKFQEITGWVAGVKLVGEVHEMDEAGIRAQLVQYPIDCLEISDASLLASLQNTSLSFVLKIQASDNLAEAIASCEKYPSVEYLFVELNQPMTGKEIRTLAASTPLLLGYEVGPGEAEELISNTEVKGFVLKGSQEIKPGFKDYDALADILEALEEQD